MRLLVSPARTVSRLLALLAWLFLISASHRSPCPYLRPQRYPALNFQPSFCVTWHVLRPTLAWYSSPSPRHPSCSAPATRKNLNTILLILPSLSSSWLVSLTPVHFRHSSPSRRSSLPLCCPTEPSICSWVLWLINSYKNSNILFVNLPTVVSHLTSHCFRTVHSHINAYSHLTVSPHQVSISIPTSPPIAPLTVH